MEPALVRKTPPVWVCNSLPRRGGEMLFGQWQIHDAFLFTHSRLKRHKVLLVTIFCWRMTYVVEKWQPCWVHELGFPLNNWYKLRTKMSFYISMGSPGLGNIVIQTDTVRKTWHLLGFSGEYEVFKFHLHINGKISSAIIIPCHTFKIRLEVNGVGDMGLFFRIQMDRFSGLDVRGVFWMLESSYGYGTPRSSRKSRRHHRPPLRRGSSSREIVQGGEEVHTNNIIDIQVPSIHVEVHIIYIIELLHYLQCLEFRYDIELHDIYNKSTWCLWVRCCTLNDI